MDSKILFKNTTTYTEDIAFEAGEAFWETQPAYKKRVKKYKVVSAIMAVTFAAAMIVSLLKNGPMLLTVGALAMMCTAVYWFLKSESMIRNSAKNFRGMDTKVTYGISESFFFVINREYVGSNEPQTRAEEIKEKIQEAIEEAKEELAEEVEEIKEEIVEELEEIAETPTPIDIINGTVIGPVVTPPESKDIAMKFSGTKNAILRSYSVPWAKPTKKRNFNIEVL